jgi:predicted ArsR family transcriptional regulator
MIKVNALHYAKLIAELLDGPWSYQEMAEHTGLHYHTVRDYVNALRKEQLVHIAYWGDDNIGRCSVPHFLFGKKTDVKRTKLSAAQRSKNYRDRKKAQALPLPWRF